MLKFDNEMSSARYHSSTVALTAGNVAPFGDFGLFISASSACV